MLPPFSFTNTFLFFSLFFFPTTHGAASDAEEGGYTACAPFSCGNFTNISYPFWNSNHQPGYCGHPKFKLDCNQEGNLTTIDINTHKFLVLEINQKSKLLKIARLDLLWGGDDDPYSCPKQYINVAVDFAFFNYTSNDDDYTLLFDCDAPSYTSSVNLESSILFSCLIDGDPDKPRDGYLVLSTKVVDFNVLRCKNRINVPVLKGVFQSYLEKDLPVEDVLIEGFEVGWNWSGVDGDKCDGCIKTGGRCGYNASKNSFMCLCPNSNYLQSNGGVCRKTPSLSQLPAPTTSSSSRPTAPSRTLEPPYAPNLEESREDTGMYSSFI